MEFFTDIRDMCTKESWWKLVFLVLSFLTVLFVISVIIGSLIIPFKIKEVISNPQTSSPAQNQPQQGSGTTEMKEGMAPAQRMHLAHAYSKIGSDFPKERSPRADKYDTSLKNPTNGRRKLKSGFKLYDNIEKAGNPMSVARGGLPMNYDLKNKLGKNANMQALEGATFNGSYGNPSDPNGGKSDIVPFGLSTRMAGVKQDLSPFTGITSAKH